MEDSSMNVMPELSLNIVDFIQRSFALPVIDVRSPAEYEHAHIPGAMNMPLFTNEERSVIGTLYLKKGSNDAILKGLEMIGPKMKDFTETGHRNVPGGEALMYCWRGGMRSNSMAWLLNTTGIKTCVLLGGYKSFRRHAHEVFCRPMHFIVLGGMTGSGKTSVLEILESRGKQVVNLEQLANHRGSVFGAIGMPEQPSTEQFENDLALKLLRIDPTQPVYIEDESLAIGEVFLPRSLYEQMASSPFIQLIAPFSRRVKTLVDEYTGGYHEDLMAAVKRIEKRLGFENTGHVLKHIRAGDMEQAVEIVLRYYDRVYTRTMNMHRHNKHAEINMNTENYHQIAEEVIKCSS